MKLSKEVLFFLSFILAIFSAILSTEPLCSYTTPLQLVFNFWLLLCLLVLLSFTFGFEAISFVVLLQVALVFPRRKLVIVIYFQFLCLRVTCDNCCSFGSLLSVWFVCLFRDLSSEGWNQTERICLLGFKCNLLTIVSFSFLFVNFM